MKQRLSEAIDDYAKHRSSKRLTKLTLNNDKTTLTALCRAVPSNLFVENITSAHMDALFEDLAGSRSDRSLGNDFYILTSFFRWCATTKRMPRWHDPLVNHSAPEWFHRERNRLPVTKFAILLDAAVSGRDRILFALALYTLGRANELVRITVGDVDFDNRKIRMPLSKNRSRGGKEADWMPIPRELRKELARWFIEYAEEVGPLRPEYYLVPALSRPRLINTPDQGRDGASEIIQVINPLRPLNPRYSTAAKDALESIGFPIRDADGKSLGEGMHTLRRSGARARFDALRAMGYDRALRQVQALLHHQFSSMTEHYIGITLDILERDEALMDEWMYPQVAPQKDVVAIPVAGLQEIHAAQGYIPGERSILAKGPSRWEQEAREA